MSLSDFENDEKEDEDGIDDERYSTSDQFVVVASSIYLKQVVVECTYYGDCVVQFSLTHSLYVHDHEEEMMMMMMICDYY